MLPAGDVTPALDPSVPEPSVPDPSVQADARTPRRPGLSPSRANDFIQCPLLYRLRVVDRLPEPPSPAAVRGTLVHAVLERLFDLPRPERSVDAALGLLPATWEELVSTEPDCAQVVPADCGLPIGYLQEGVLCEQSIQLHPGDKVILYTDGLTETHTVSGEMFGEERLTQAVSEHGRKEPQVLVAAIKRAADEFAAGVACGDDVAIVVMEMMPQRVPAVAAVP